MITHEPDTDHRARKGAERTAAVHPPHRRPGRRHPPRPGDGAAAGPALRRRVRLLRPRHAHLGADPAAARRGGAAAARRTALRAGPGAQSGIAHAVEDRRHPDLWPGLPPELLHDPDDEVAQSAWRAAVVLVPDAARQRLADELTAELGRGGLDLHRSLSRAFVALDDVSEPALDRIADTGDARAQAHVRSTRALLADPEGGFDASLFEAKRTAALGPSGQ